MIRASVVQPGDHVEPPSVELHESDVAGCCVKSVACTTSRESLAVMLAASGSPAWRGSVTIRAVAPCATITRGALSQPCPATRFETRAAIPPAIGAALTIVPFAAVATTCADKRAPAAEDGSGPSRRSVPCCQK